MPRDFQIIDVRGRLQREQGVIHVVADRLIDMSSHLAALSDDHGLADGFQANVCSSGRETKRGSASYC